MSSSMNAKKRRIAFSSNRNLDKICALVLPNSSKIMSMHDNFNRQNTYLDITNPKNTKESSFETEERLNQTLMGAKNCSPFSDGMFNTLQEPSYQTNKGKGVWKELFNFVQGRSKSFGVHNFILTKKCKDDIIQLIKSFKASTDLILLDYEVFQRYIFEKKINPILENKALNPDDDTLCQTYIKLANDKEFFNQLREQFPSKLCPRSETKQWKAQIINEEQTPMSKEKIRAKKKAQFREIKQMRRILNFHYPNPPSKKVKSGFKIDIINEPERRHRKVLSTSPPVKSKNHFSTAINEFMQSETFKLLMDKRRQKSKDSEESECQQETKDDASTPKQNLKRRGIIFRKSALQKDESQNNQSTPNASISKESKLKVNSPNNFISFSEKWN